MDFFARQDDARRKTSLLLFYFGLAVACTILLVYLLPVLGWYFWQTNYGPREIQTTVGWWYPDLFILVCGVTLALVLCGALFKITALRRSGGAGVAELLGGRPVPPDTDDFFEKRLRNVVEEMAIASGTPVPPVYVLDHEKGINAFAAGFSPTDAVVAVTYGTLTGLSRDELQGVIAHEFSHILNNDSRMNINLMGIIHGLIIIGITGRIILQFSGRSTRHRSSRDSGQIVAFAIAAGLILWIVGSCGMLFAKLIKASISRSREQLADASAVQFTRNPAGLTGALKKIGGLSQGSRLATAQAEQASHMFFGNGVRGSIFSTHPPLAERVRWLEPTFDGNFEPVTPQDLRAQLSRFEGAPKEKEEKADVVDLFTDPGKLAVTATVLGASTPLLQARPNNPEALIASIGAPMEKHTDAAKKMMDAIPEKIKQHARNPYGARMLIYYLLLDAEAGIREKQIAAIKLAAEPEVVKALEEALSKQVRLAPELRLPIIDLAIPALRLLSPNQYLAFRKTITLLIDADDQIDLFEYVLQRVLTHHLAPVFGNTAKPKAANYYAIRGLAKETSVILSTLARRGQDGETTASEAFHSAAETIADPKTPFEFLPESECTWDHLDDALNKMNEASFKVKKWLLGSALACLMHDREITVGEVELFRAIAVTLGCPVPPWVAPTKL